MSGRIRNKPKYLTQEQWEMYLQICEDMGEKMGFKFLAAIRDARKQSHT